MEEHEFLLEICIAVLGTDKNIRFAGVMDNEGKLLVAKYRKNIQKPLIASSSTKDMSSSSFYAGHLTVSIKKQFESHLGELHFQLTEFERVRLLQFQSHLEKIVIFVFLWIILPIMKILFQKYWKTYKKNIAY